MIDIQLGDKLQSDLTTMLGHSTKEGVSSKAVRFDERGTLHVIGYNEDGKKIDDLAVREQKFTTVKKDETFEDILKEEQLKTARSKTHSDIANVIIILIGVVTLFCLWTLLPK